MIERTITKNLTAWKEKADRQVLLLRGARQVGKTFIVRQFAKQFDSFMEVNFIENPELKIFFQSGSISPKVIIQKLEAHLDIKLIPGKSLLFFDEIQACPEAINALRFFHEKIPALHVVAAGSLLEFALNEIPSFGVGRVTSLFMNPVSFSEFVHSVGKQSIIDYIKSTAPHPIDSPFHNTMLELYRTYSIIGGLPKVVSQYIFNKDIHECIRMLDSLILSYEDDFAKYKTRIDPSKIRTVFSASAKQAGSKFVATQATAGESTSGILQALDLLVMAGIVHKIHRSSGNGIPLGAEVSEKHFKIIPFDIGIYNRLLGVSISDVLLKNISDLVHSGAAAEVFCGTEIIASQDPYIRPRLYYWGRGVPGSQAEVDYLVQQGSCILPIEVKAGTKGQMQSLYKFMREKNCSVGIRASSENFSEYNAPGNLGYKVQVLPVYWIREYL